MSVAGNPRPSEGRDPNPSESRDPNPSESRDLRPVQSIRADVPALRRMEGGLPVAYFDGPGGTQVPAVVADTVRNHLLDHNANAGWGFPTSREATGATEAFRRAAADFLGGRPDEVVFGPNMTTLTVRFAEALARRLEPGDEILVTRLDHRANVDPWRRVAAARDLVVRSVPFDRHGVLDSDALASLLGPRTRLAAVTAAANAIGSVVQLPAVRELTRSAGALLYVDAVHAAPHLPVDVDAIGCDALVCSPYKFYGPHGGVLWIRSDLLAELDTPRLGPAPDTGPARWEIGTPSFEAMAGTTAAIDWLAGLATGRATSDGRRQRLGNALRGLHARGEALGRRLWEGLREIEGIRLFGPEPGMPRTPTVSFVLERVASDVVARRLAEEHAVFVSHGNFYAPDVLSDLDVRDATGLVRAGCACYTTVEEIDRLLSGVEAIAGGR